MAELLTPLLPPGWEASTGIVFDADGEQSGQEDVIVHDRNVLPPLFKHSEQSAVPLESTLALLEVKSTLSADGIKQALSHATRISAFRSRLELRRPEQASPVGLSHPLYGILAFSSDLGPGLEREAARLRKYELKVSGSSNARVSFLFVLGKGLVTLNPLSLPAASEIAYESLLTTSAPATQLRAFLGFYLSMLRKWARVRQETFHDPNLYDYLGE